MKIKRYEGFTLLEVMIVVIIIGVLAALALPKLYRVIEKSRSAEAMSAISSIRVAMENFLIDHPSEELLASTIAFPGEWKRIGIEDPATSPGSHFSYILHRNIAGGNDRFIVIAVRNCLDGGSPRNFEEEGGPHDPNSVNFVFYGLNYDLGQSSLCGFGDYKGIKNGNLDCTWGNILATYGANLSDIAMYAFLIAQTCQG